MPEMDCGLELFYVYFAFHFLFVLNLFRLGLCVLLFTVIKFIQKNRGCASLCAYMCLLLPYTHSNHNTVNTCIIFNGLVEL